MNSDCIYYVMDGRYTDHSNSQVENTHVVICSLGDSRVLNWKKGEFINYIRDAMFGLMILNYVAPFLLILILLLSLIHYKITRYTIRIGVSFHIISTVG